MDFILYEFALYEYIRTEMFLFFKFFTHLLLSKF